MNPPFLNRKTGDYEMPAPTVRVTTKGVHDIYRRIVGQPLLAVVTA